MDELLKALVARYNSATGAALRALTVGGLWLTQAPQASTGVYVVMTPMPSPEETAQSPEATKPFTQDCFIQFTFSTLNGTAQDLLAAMKAFDALYKFCTFTMTGYTLLVSKRLKCHGPMRDDLTRGNIAYLEYKFSIGG